MSKKMAHATTVEALANLTRTATANGAAIDVREYSEDINLTLMSEVLTGTTPTLDVTVEDSADGSTGWAAVSGAAFTQVTDAADAHETISVDTDSTKRYLRIVATMGGTTPSGAFGVTLSGFQQTI